MCTYCLFEVIWISIRFVLVKIIKILVTTPLSEHMILMTLADKLLTLKALAELKQTTLNIFLYLLMKIRVGISWELSA